MQKAAGEYLRLVSVKGKPTPVYLWMDTECRSCCSQERQVATGRVVVRMESSRATLKNESLGHVNMAPRGANDGITDLRAGVTSTFVC